MKSYLKVKLDQRYFNTKEYKSHLPCFCMFTGYAFLCNDFCEVASPSLACIDLDNG